FIEPTNGNETALGYDLAFQPSIHDLLEQAQKEGGAAVSGPLTLQYYKSMKIAVLAAMPVYFPEFGPASLAESYRQNQSYVIAVFIIDELMSTIAERAP